MVLSPELAVELGNRIAMVGWIVLILLPRRWTWVSAYPGWIAPLLLGLAYCGLMLTSFGRVPGDYNSLAGIKTLFQSDMVLAAGWLHYLAFDLFVGSLIAREADQIGLSRLLQFPILLLTFWFGPGGLVLFLLTRSGLALSDRTGAKP